MVRSARRIDGKKNLAIRRSRSRPKLPRCSWRPTWPMGKGTTRPRSICGRRPRANSVSDTYSRRQQQDPLHAVRQDPSNRNTRPGHRALEHGWLAHHTRYAKRRQNAWRSCVGPPHVEGVHRRSGESHVLLARRGPMGGGRFSRLCRMTFRWHGAFEDIGGAIAVQLGTALFSQQEPGWSCAK